MEDLWFAYGKQIGKDLQWKQSLVRKLSKKLGRKSKTSGSKQKEAPRTNAYILKVGMPDVQMGWRWDREGEDGLCERQVGS